MRKIAEASMRDRRLSLGARLIRKMWLSVAACVLAGTAWADTSRSSSALAPQAVTRSILIGNRLIPRNLHAFVGEEIRWVNRRQRAVKITLQGPKRVDGPCGEGRSSPDFAAEMEMIPPGHSVAACFAHGGIVRYTVWLDAHSPRSASLTGQVMLEATA